MAKDEPGYMTVLFDRRYRSCTYVIMLCALFNQLTGINAVNIYSNTIFTNIQEQNGGGGIGPRLGSAYLGIA